MKRLTICLIALSLMLPFAVQAAEPAAPSPADSLRATEIAFAKSVADGDATKFASFIADDAVFLSEPTLRGKKAVVDGWAVFFGENAPKIAWEPVDAEVNDSGELGITRGPYTVTSKRKDGSTHVSKGTFMSIWRHQPDGSWKIIFDGGAACRGGDS